MADEKTDENKEDKSSSSDTEVKRTPAEERTEYFEKLEKWLHEAYAWHSVAATLPYYLMSGQIMNSSSGVLPFISQVSPVPNASQSPVTGTNEQENDNLTRRRPQEPVGSPIQTPGAEGFEYRIPPVWKRFVAEFIDTAILLLMKLTITLIAIDRFGIIDMDDLNLLEIDLLMGYKMALEMTYGLIVLEIAYRVIVCIFEAFWLYHGINGRSGTTPGKWMMGLRVVQCRSVTPVERPEEPGIVLVSPGTDLDLLLTLRRSMVKSLMLVSFFPISFTLFIFRFNRTGYDLVCNSIVVEDPFRNQNNNRVHQN